ncbi:MAG: ABC transporter ATP-binding protein [Clostridia bacterium]|nr:ABC transporter ATP-binding protein [Clostridia bacterium]
MNRGMGGFGPRYEHKKVPPPKGVGDLPRYLKELLGGFFFRFAYIVRLVWQSGKWILFLLSFIALFKGITPVIGSLISKSILNELQTVVQKGALPENDFWSSPVLYLLILLFTHRILVRVINNVSSALNRIAGEKVVKQVKVQIMEKSKELDLASFDDPAFYEKMENANREAGNRPLHILTETFGIVSTVIEFISYLVILLTAPGLGWAVPVILAVSVPSAIINFIYRKKNFQYMRFRSKERRQMNYYSGTLVDKDRIKEVRMFDLADTFIGRFLQVFDKYYRGLRRLILSESAWHVAISVITCGTNLLFYLLIAKQVFTGQIMIGDYSLYTGAIGSVATCVSTLITTSATIYEGTLFIDNLIAFMKEKQTVLPRNGVGLEVARDEGHTIEFKDVTFRYPGTSKNVLEKVNLTIRSGESVVLVGLNGAGKTTLIKLLTRLYDPTEGQILLDGKDLRDYDVKKLYRIFGIIFQDFGKYAVSVEENIRFGDIHKQAPMEEVQAAAIQSAAHDYIQSLPDGYDTPLMRIFEPNGMELSIGQWQKLAIARAFYADSDIMILDEPTASLDPIAEQEIYNQFDALRADKTTLFVSHRLSSATTADQIIVLENGQLIENGTHEALMAAGGKYYELFSTQAKRYLSSRPEPREEHPEFRPKRHTKEFL